MWFLFLGKIPKLATGFLHLRLIFWSLPLPRWTNLSQLETYVLVRMYISHQVHLHSCMESLNLLVCSSNLDKWSTPVCMVQYPCNGRSISRVNSKILQTDLGIWVMNLNGIAMGGSKILRMRIWLWIRWICDSQVWCCGDPSVYFECEKKHTNI